MSDGIIIALIGLAASVSAALISAKVASNKVMTAMQTEIAVMKNEITAMHKDVSEHNNYAKLFAENVPVIQEQMKVANNRIKDLEEGQKLLQSFHMKGA